MDIGDYCLGESAEIDFSLQSTVDERESNEAVTVNTHGNGISYQKTVTIKITSDNGGWGDNTNGRRDYTNAQIEAGELGSIITFNSISDGATGHEFNFVGARKVGDTGSWIANSIWVEDEAVYDIRA